MYLLVLSGNKTLTVEEMDEVNYLMGNISEQIYFVGKVGQPCFQDS